MQALKRMVRLTPLRRRHLVAARMCCERNLFARRGATGDRDRPRILAYHAVGTKEWGNNDVSPARFRRQLELALTAGYRFVPAGEIAGGRGTQRDLAITFDDGVRSAATVAAPVLKDLGIPWTLFVVSGWADGDADAPVRASLLGWREIEDLAGSGVSIGSHSVTHRNFAWLQPHEVHFELEESRRVIESRLGIRADEFAIPWGQSRDWTALAASAAADAGYTTVYSQAEETRLPGTLARTFITRWDNDRVFRGVLGGAFDRWEEWY
jgi:peptidoglycan/xylan/chitin deacetylase (PgdA/CDA1 family)